MRGPEASVEADTLAPEYNAEATGRGSPPQIFEGAAKLRAGRNLQIERHTFSDPSDHAPDFALVIPFRTWHAVA